MDTKLRFQHPDTPIMHNNEYSNLSQFTFEFWISATLVHQLWYTILFLIATVKCYEYATTG